MSVDQHARHPLPEHPRHARARLRAVPAGWVASSRPVIEHLSGVLDPATIDAAVRVYELMGATATNDRLHARAAAGAHRWRSLAPAPLRSSTPVVVEEVVVEPVAAVLVPITSPEPAPVVQLVVTPEPEGVAAPEVFEPEVAAPKVVAEPAAIAEPETVEPEPVVQLQPKWDFDVVAYTRAQVAESFSELAA